MASIALWSVHDSISHNKCLYGRRNPATQFVKSTFAAFQKNPPCWRKRRENNTTHTQQQKQTTTTPCFWSNMMASRSLMKLQTQQFGQFKGVFRKENLPLLQKMHFSESYTERQAKRGLDSVCERLRFLWAKFNRETSFTTCYHLQISSWGHNINHKPCYWCCIDHRWVKLRMVTTRINMWTGVTGIGALSLIGGDVPALMTTLGSSTFGPLVKAGVAFPLVYHYLGKW